MPITKISVRGARQHNLKNINVEIPRNTLTVVTGLIFLLTDKRPWVKFHAAQSIAVFGGLTVIRIGLLFMSHLLGWAIFGLIGLVSLVLWIFLMVKAYQHETVRIPIAADIADSLAGK